MTSSDQPRVKSVAAFSPVLISSTKSCRLLRLSGDGQSSKMPILLIPALTANATSGRLMDGHALSVLLGTQGYDVYEVQWQRHWTSNGNERFSPLVKDLDQLISAVPVTHGQRLHPVAAGSGAIVALKWLQLNAKKENPLQIAGLSLHAPSMNVQNRTPRTSLAYAPEHCCVVADEFCTVTNWQDTLKMSRRLPASPIFMLARSRESFLLSEDGSVRVEVFMRQAVELNGSWDLTWVDWLSEVNRRHLA